MATIQKRGNSYRLRASAGYDAKGKQIVRSMTWTPAPGMTKKQIAKELERQKVKFDEQVKTGQFLDGNIKFQEFSEEWFESYGKEHLRERTYQRYKELSVRTYAAIGHIPIQKLQPQHLLAFYRQLGSEGIRAGAETAVPRERFQELLADRQWTQAFLSQTSGLAPSTIGAAVKGKSISSKSASAIAQAFEEPVENLFTLKKDQTPLSSKTIRHYHTFISSVLERAVKWQLIPGNPCHRIDPPKVDHKEIKFMQEGELERFIECLSQEPIEYQSAFLILVLTGMRRGELMGLEWPDIDLEEGRIMIRRTSQYSDLKGYLYRYHKNRAVQTLHINPTGAMPKIKGIPRMAERTAPQNGRSMGFSMAEQPTAFLPMERKADASRGTLSGASKVFKKDWFGAHVLTQFETHQCDAFDWSGNRPSDSFGKAWPQPGKHNSKYL